MKIFAFLQGALVAGVALGSPALGRAADEPGEKKPARQEWQKLSPEERQARAKESREKFEKMTPEQREAVRKVWRGRIEKRIADLKKKKTEGTLTEQETKRLEQWEARLRHWDELKLAPGPASKPAEKPVDKK